MQKISEISTLFDTNQDARNSTPYYILYREERKQSFASMSSGRHTKDGRSSFRLVREQIMMAKGKAKLRQHEQRTSNEGRTQFVSFGARTDHDGKGESKASSA